MEQTRFCRTPRVHFGQLHDEWLGIDAEAGFCYSLNRTGGFVWQMLEHPVTLAEICAALCREFEVELEPCQRDVEALLAELEELGLVVRDSGLSRGDKPQEPGP
ncbi:MAG: hypothetical protein Kow001_00660 [Acidobacteriota bacterium]